MVGGVEPLPGNALFMKKMTGIEIRSRDFLPAFAIIEKAFHDHEKKKWASEGPGWEPLADSTIVRKQGLSDEMMVRGEPGHTDGQGLKQSLTSRSPESIYTVTPLSLTMGTSVSYAYWHQHGADHLPIRHVVDPIDTPRGAAMMKSWLNILQIYVINGVAEAAAYGAGVSQV